MTMVKTAVLVVLALHAVWCDPNSTYCNVALPQFPALPAGVKLLQAHVIHRHGDRVPDSVVPWLNNYEWKCDMQHLTTTTDWLHRNNFVIKHESDALLKGNCYPGQLSPRGFNQAEAVGKALKHYQSTGFLSTDLDVSEIEVISAQSERNVETAQGVLSGLWSNAHQVVDITRYSATRDFTIPFAQCTGAAAAQILTKATATPSVSALLATLPGLAAQLSKEFGRNISTGEVTLIWDFTASTRCHNFPLPTGANTTTLDIVGAGLHKYWRLLHNYVPYRPYEAAPMLSQILPILEPLLNSTETNMTDPRYFQYSVHDTTIAPILSALGIAPEIPWVGYVSNLIFEVLETGSGTNLKTRYVRTLYNGNVKAIPGCNTSGNTFQGCPANEFLAMMKKLVASDWASVCYDNKIAGFKAAPV